MRAVDAAGAWLVQNPRSNEGNNVGYPRALGASRRVALGTDGYLADMRVEADALERLARAHADGAFAPRIAGGFGIAHERFGLPFPPRPEAGAAADLVVREADCVRDVVVAGRLVVDRGVLVGADLAEIRARAAEEAPRLWRRMASFA